MMQIAMLKCALAGAPGCDWSPSFGSFQTSCCADGRTYLVFSNTALSFWLCQLPTLTVLNFLLFFLSSFCEEGFLLLLLLLFFWRGRGLFICFRIVLFCFLFLQQFCYTTEDSLSVTIWTRLALNPKSSCLSLQSIIIIFVCQHI